MRSALSLDRFVRWDIELCVRCNRIGQHPAAARFFRTVSYLGNGLFWYGLMLALLLSGREAAVPAVIRMLLVGLSCTVVYKWIKGRTLRPRPFSVNPDIVAAARPLDEFSFPSGHTMHAVAFSAIGLAYYPQLAFVVIPFTALVAVSRPILGLHYPSDVIAGAALGISLAAAGMSL